MVVGQIARDLVLRVDDMPEAGRAADASWRQEILGGKGANQAVSVAQLDEHVGLVGVVGDDHAGDDLLTQARSDGIDVTHVVRRPGAPTGVIVEVLEADGDWRYVQHLPDPVLVNEDDIAAAADALRGASVVLLQLQQPPAPLIAAAQHAKAGGALVVCDGALADDIQRGALLALTDVIRGDAHEAETLIGRRADDVDRAVAAARDLLAAGPSVVVLGCSAGNLFVWSGGHLLVPRIDVPVVDTTGAGDALTAALAVALLHRAPPRDAARAAVAAASVTVGHAGGRPHLDRALLRHATERIDDALRRRDGWGVASSAIGRRCHPDRGASHRRSGSYTSLRAVGPATMPT